jgi:primosomal protein N' (replication factor Y)
LACSAGDTIVRVLPDGPIDKTFDYVVPARLAPLAAVGAQVRVPLQGRRVSGWIVDIDVSPPAGVSLAELIAVRGMGPPPEVVALAAWAAHRWAGRAASVLAAASPPALVSRLPPALMGTVPASGGVADLPPEALHAPGAVVRLPPPVDHLPLILAAARLGSALVVTPSVSMARALAARVRRAGVGVAVLPRDWAQAMAGAGVTIGARSAVWAPTRDPAVIVVIDEHDEALKEERVPTWHARDVAIERARRAGIPVVLVSPCPSLEALGSAPLVRPSRNAERQGWPALEVVDMRKAPDPARTGLYSEALVRLLRSEARVVCVLNRAGRARLLACVACGELATCERCGAAVTQPTADFECPRCATMRPPVCLRCHKTRFRNLRAGVARVREELEALAREEVVDVTADGDELRPARVHVGTEAALHRVVEADAVAFLDFDQELLAPRYRAAEEAFALLARAARLVGGRRPGSRVLVQTRVPNHEVIDAALHADPERVAAAEAQRRADLRFPPVAPMAAVSGPGAAELVAALEMPPVLDQPRLEVLGPAAGRWLVRATSHEELAEALARAPRPAARVRIEVDPLRV